MALNRPLVRIAADFTAGPPGDVLAGFTAIGLGAGPTAVRAWATQRGRQYELGHAEAGTLTLDVTDASEYLNPVNTGSPWNSGPNKLLPYRRIQIGAWWNAATNSTAGNLLNPANRSSTASTFYDPSFESLNVWWGVLTGSPTRTIVGSPVHSGSSAMSVVCAAATDVPVFRMMTVPGQMYTVSLWIQVSAAHTVTATFLDYPNAAGATLATTASTTTGAYERLVLTGVAVGAVSAVKLVVTAGTFSTTYFVDDVQAELGATATTFTSSGPTYVPIWTGYIERYPQSWDMAGFRGVKPLTAVDALSPLSRIVISQSYLATILADNPTAVLPYSEPGPPHLGLRPVGGSVPVGYTHLGSNGSVNYGGDTFLDNGRALTVVQQNKDPATSGDPLYITLAGTFGGVISVDPQGFTLEMWMRWSAGTAYFGAGIQVAGEDPNTEALGLQKYVGWTTLAGKLGLNFTDPNGGSVPPFGPPGITGYPDGIWHYMVLVFPGGSTIKAVTDANVGGAPSLGFTPSQTLGINNVFVQTTTYFADPVSKLSVANLAIYPTALSNTTLAAHYQRGIGYLGESSGARAGRLLTQYWAAASVVAAGVATMAPDYSYDGRGLLGVLEEIADTEQGLVWCDRAGVIHFDSRDTRTLAGQTPVAVFGENTAGGELPYESLTYDFDPTYVYSEADLTSYTGTVIKTVNATSQTNYGQRILSATIQAADDYQVAQAGVFFTTRYAAPKLRISSMVLDPGSNPLLWSAVLALDIGTRVTVKRRTSAVTVSADYFIEQISHQVNNDESSWKVSYQLSPVFLPTVWILGDATYGVLGTTTVCAY
jgi:hypothetical protein